MTDTAAPPTGRAAGTPAAGPDGSARSRAREVLLVVPVVLALAVTALVVRLDVEVAGVVFPPDTSTTPGWTTAACGLLLLLPGVVVAHRVPRHRLGRVLIGFGLAWVLDALAGSWFLAALAFDRPLGGLAHTAVNRWGAFLLLTLPLVLVLFPDGRLPRSPLWRAVAIASPVSAAVLPCTLVFVPVAVLDARFGAVTPPEVVAMGIDTFSVESPAWPALLTVAYVLVPVSLVLAMAVVVHRFRRARGVRRRQMRWLAWAALADALVFTVARSLPEWASSIGLLLAIGLTTAAILVAITRYRLYDIDRLLPSTIVALLLGLLVVAVDVTVLAVAGRLLGGTDAVFLAVAVVAVAYTPLRTRLWRLARRITSGGREDPYAAVATLAGRLESAEAPAEQLAALARSVATAFRLPYVRVEIHRADGGRTSVEHGHPAPDTVELPVRYRDDEVGRVVVGGGRRLSETDQRLLGDLLRQAAAAVRASALGTSLTAARTALVTAREEERRRLRRDLHDSVGPGLGAVTLRIETARALAARDPAAADRALERAVDDVGALLTDVRRLVHDLRPPAVDELGLAGALREQADRLSGESLAVVVRSGDLGALPAAVEVAAYRIAAEAMTNVVRHAGAGRAEVELHRTGEGLEVTVTDDGRGIAPDVAAGVGTLSLRERAAELGGRSTVTCPPGGGTTVTAVLPCPEPVPDPATVSVADTAPEEATR